MDNQDKSFQASSANEGNIQRRYPMNDQGEKEVIEFEYYDLMHPDTIYFKFFANTIEYGSEQGRDLFCIEYYKYCFLRNMEQNQLRDEMSSAIGLILFVIEQAKNIQLDNSHLQRRVPAYIEYELLSYSRGIDLEGGNGDVGNIILLLKRILNRKGTMSYVDLEFQLRGILKTEFARRATHRFVLGHLAHLKN
jgi:hypothetical protein